MVSRAGDWMKQAERDLGHARRSADGGDHEWACFAAQQAAEKSLKAVIQAGGGEARGHSVRALLEGILVRKEDPDKNELLNLARELDRHYVTTRYPNSVPEGAPFEAYDEEESKRAVGAAERIVRFGRDHLAGS